MIWYELIMSLIRDLVWLLCMYAFNTWISHFRIKFVFTFSAFSLNYSYCLFFTRLYACIQLFAHYFHQLLYVRSLMFPFVSISNVLCKVIQYSVKLNVVWSNSCGMNDYKLEEPCFSKCEKQKWFVVRNIHDLM